MSDSPQCVERESKGVKWLYFVQFLNPEGYIQQFVQEYLLVFNALTKC